MEANALCLFAHGAFARTTAADGARRRRRTGITAELEPRLFPSDRRHSTPPELEPRRAPFDHTRVEDSYQRRGFRFPLTPDWITPELEHSTLMPETPAPHTSFEAGSDTDMAKRSVGDPLAGFIQTEAHVPAKDPELRDHLARWLHVDQDAPCPASGDTAGMGCAVGCQCGWGRRCYPKHIFVLSPKDAGTGNELMPLEATRLDAGVCDLAPPVLVLFATFALLGVVLGFAVVRFALLLPGRCSPDPQHRPARAPPAPPESAPEAGGHSRAGSR